MKTRTLTLFLTIAALAVLGSGSVQADCASGHAFSQWDTGTGSYFYAYPGTDSVVTYGTGTLGLAGKFWQTSGYTSGNDGGTCGIDSWFKNYAGPQWYVNGVLSGVGCSVTGCPGGFMTVMVDTTYPVADPQHPEIPASSGAKFAVGNAAECFDCTNYYFYGSSVTFQPIPKPRIALVSKVGNVSTLNMSFGNSESAFFGTAGTAATVITGYNLMRAYGTADPGRLPGPYTLVQTVPYGTAPVLNGFSLDCATVPAGQDVFYGVQVQFGTNAAQVSDYVGATTRVKCNSTLADPGQFKPIQKPKPKMH